MPTYYVRSTDGNNADDGSTWALADADLHTPTYAAGDTIYVSQVHAQSTGAAITIDSNGTVASPTKIICGNDAAEPPTAVATTATVTTTGGFNITVSDCCYVYGISFISSAHLNLNNGAAACAQVYKNCSFQINGTSGQRLQTGQQGAAIDPITIWENCTVKFANAAHRITSYNGRLVWNGGSIESGSTALTTCLFEISSGGRPGQIEVSGVDLSNMGAANNIVNAAYGGGGVFKIRNCKLPASWTGALSTGTFAPGFRAEMYNCYKDSTQYLVWIEDYAGTIRDDTGVYNDAGATDGTSRVSWKMTSSANAEYPIIVLRSPEIVRWNTVTGSSITVTVEINHDSQGSGTGGAVKDNEVWLEVQYLGTSQGASTFISDCKADVLATAADQTTSSASWTGDSAGWDTQKLSVTFTPQVAGFIHATVCVAKAGATIYVDPLLTVG